MKDVVDLKLRQRGRASLDFMTFMGAAGAPVFAQTARTMAASFPEPEKLPDDLDARYETVESRLREEPAYRTQKLMGEFHGRMHGVIAAEAFDEVRSELEPTLKALDEGPATLDENPGFQAPDYWDGVEVHRTAGGWDGHDYQGFIHSELIHRKVVASMFGDIFKQRREIAAMAPRNSYRRILDMGCSTGHYTVALATTYPEAEIHGVDLSIRTLEHSRRVANANGWAWKLRRCAAEDTGYPDASFDLATSYILLHEIPADIIARVMAEAFRVLEPGGDMLMGDVSRYEAMDKLQVWKADTGARFGGEPHWRSSASADLEAIARDAGFVDVKGRGLGENGYPYVIQGRKPE